MRLIIAKVHDYLKTTGAQGGWNYDYFGSGHAGFEGNIAFAYGDAAGGGNTHEALTFHISHPLPMVAEASKGWMVQPAGQGLRGTGRTGKGEVGSEVSFSEAQRMKSSVLPLGTTHCL